MDQGTIACGELRHTISVGIDTRRVANAVRNPYRTASHGDREWIIADHPAFDGPSRVGVDANQLALDRAWVRSPFEGYPEAAIASRHRKNAVVIRKDITSVKLRAGGRGRSARSRGRSVARTRRARGRATRQNREHRDESSRRTERGEAM